MRLHTQWQIQTMLDSTNEMKPVLIDEEWSGNGLILFRPGPREADAFKHRHIPVVNVSSECFIPDIPTVIPDNVEVGRIAAQHLLSMGLKRFAFWGDPTRVYSRDREKGFRDTLKENGFECRVVYLEPDRFPWDQRWQHIHNFLISELPKLKTPTGLFAKDDILAANIINACSELGLDVPDAISVVGMNSDDLFCQTTAPPLTSVRYPGEAIGYRAAEVLESMMKSRGFDRNQKIVVPIEGITIRESTNRLAFKDQIIVGAVEHIRKEAIEYPLRVEELLTKIPVSRAAFNKRFARAMGCSPKAEITRVRLEHLKSLLVTTDWTISRIASKMNFESSEELGRFFRRETGHRPTEYRKKFVRLVTEK